MPGWRRNLTELYQTGHLSAYAWHLAAALERIHQASHGTPLTDELLLAVILAAQNTITHKSISLALDNLPALEELLEYEGSRSLRADAAAPELPRTLARELRQPANATLVAIDPEPGSIPALPLVLEDSRLYLQRYWLLENRLVELLRARSRGAPAERGAPTAAEIGNLTALTLDQSQVDALVKAATNPFSVITGGPGSGKTTIVAVLLALLLSRDSELRVSLCAPTGKAQARLKEALDEQIEHHLRLESQTLLRERLCALESSTIQRLLRMRPPLNRFTHNRDNPLELDLLILDEASMVDLALMVALLEALPDGCQVVFLGDSQQLAAVEAGAVLLEIYRAWQGSARVARLNLSHRFAASGAIGQMQAALAAGDGARAWQILRDGSDPALAWGEPARNAQQLGAQLSQFLDGHPFKNYLRATEPAEAFRWFDTLRLLCATRHGVSGVEQVNRTMQQLLQVQRYGHGYPVMVRVNDYARNLFNGDVGIFLSNPAQTGECLAWFPDPDNPGGYRALHQAELPPHEALFAMTVHKAQGSGFGSVLLLLPHYDSPLLTRELIYTAVTRAKESCTIWCGQQLFIKAVATATSRHSGIGAKLKRGDSTP